MSDQTQTRYRIKYAKTSAMRYTSHLDTLRAWERTFRRATLPLSFTQGYNPRPKLNLGVALPLGFTSQCELLEVWLEQTIDRADIECSLAPALPPGLNILEIDPIDLSSPPLQHLISSAEYQISFDPSPSIEFLRDGVVDLLNRANIPRARRGKAYDLRPRIEALEVQFNNGNSALKMRLATKEGFTGRPEEVLLTLGLDPDMTHIHRSRLFLQEPSN
jgi:radical SAM-linked protein